MLEMKSIHGKSQLSGSYWFWQIANNVSTAVEEPGFVS